MKEKLKQNNKYQKILIILLILLILVIDAYCLFQHYFINDWFEYSENYPTKANHGILPATLSYYLTITNGGMVKGLPREVKVLNIEEIIKIKEYLKMVEKYDDPTVEDHGSRSVTINGKKYVSNKNNSEYIRKIGDILKSRE